MQNQNIIALATNNKGKIAEFTAILANIPWLNEYKFITQQELHIPAAPENGMTFVENAINKARHVCVHGNCAAIADDSGLVVDALHGAPGIFSARYADCNANYKYENIEAMATDNKSNAKSNTDSSAKNIAKLLQELRNIPDAERSAHFYCVIAYLRYARDPAPIICQGIWEGKILTAPQGEHGFGYDPIFWVPHYACSAAALPMGVKNSISHRAQALQQFAIIMQNNISPTFRAN